MSKANEMKPNVEKVSAPEGKQEKTSQKDSSRGKGSGKSQKPSANKKGYSWTDDNWFSSYPELLKATANLPFPYKPGTKVKNALRTYVTSSGKEQDYEIPGTLCVHWVPSIGISKDTTDPASIAARELYSIIRSKFSGTIYADGPDMMIQVLALDSIYAFLAYMKRLYRIVNFTTKDNYLYPYGILRSLGFNENQTTTLLANRIDLYGKINTLIRMTDKLVCPDVFNIVKRHYWMSDNIYLDVTALTGQTYIMVPDAFYKFELLATPAGAQAGGLKMTPFLPKKMGNDTVLDDLFNYGRALINALAEWEDCYNINGYFQRAFEDAKLFMVDMLNEDEIIQPIYNSDVLMQIHNASGLIVDPGWFNDHEMEFECNISQDPRKNVVLSTPRIKWPGGAGLFGMMPFTEVGLLDIPLETPTEHEVMLASRLHTIYTNSVSGGNGYSTATCAGSELVLYFGTNYTNAEGKFDVLHFGSYAWLGFDGVEGANTMVAAIASLVGSGAFEYHPLYYVSVYNSSVRYGTVLGSVYNVTAPTQEQLEQINTVALYSEFRSFGTDR